MTMTSLYVYAVVPADRELDLTGIASVGGDASLPVEIVSRSQLPVAGVVSAAPQDLRGKRRDLLAHQAVLDRLGQHVPLLPMRFGVVAADEESLVRELSANATRYAERLSSIAGRVELNVKAIADQDVILASVAREPTVRAAQESAQRFPGYERNVVLGEHVAEAVRQRQQLVGERLYAKLRPLAETAAALEPGDRYLLNASFLLEQHSVSQFIATIDELQNRLSPAVELVVTGPLPPYSFVDG
jgi:hypothetical protein